MVRGLKPEQTRYWISIKCGEQNSNSATGGTIEETGFENWQSGFTPHNLVQTGSGASLTP